MSFRKKAEAIDITTADVLEQLKQKAAPGKISSMRKFGMTVENRLGVSIPDIQQIAREVGDDHQLALALWKTGIAEAKIVASIIADPDKITTRQAERWVKTFNSWDVCDHVCQNLFDKTPWAWKVVQVWAKRDEEFLKRAAFSLLACLAWHDKHATDERFVALFPIIKNAARDERNFVKKAVNWALRNIGKRNRRLIHEAFQLAKEIQGMNSRAARCVAADAMRELERTVIRQKLVKRTKGQEVATIPKHNRHKTRSRRILHTPPSASRMILRSHHAASFPFLPC